MALHIADTMDSADIIEGLELHPLAGSVSFFRLRSQVVGVGVVVA